MEWIGHARYRKTSHTKQDETRNQPKNKIFYNLIIFLTYHQCTLPNLHGHPNVSKSRDQRVKPIPCEGERHPWARWTSDEQMIETIQTISGRTKGRNKPFPLYVHATLPLTCHKHHLSGM